MPAPEVSPGEWANMATAASQPGVHARGPGFRERAASFAQNLKNIEIVNLNKREIFGRPALEFFADVGVGFIVKQGVKSGVILAGAGTLGGFGAAIVAGAAAGGAFAGGKEWFTQARQNWREPLPPEAVNTRQKILERCKDLTPNDWEKLGKVTLKGVATGAVGGFIGAALAEAYSAATAGASGVSAPSPDQDISQPDAGSPTEPPAAEPKPPGASQPGTEPPPSSATAPADASVPRPGTEPPIGNPGGAPAAPDFGDGTGIPSGATPAAPAPSTEFPASPSGEPIPPDSSVNPPGSTPPSAGVPFTPPAADTLGPSAPQGIFDAGASAPNVDAPAVPAGPPIPSAETPPAPAAPPAPAPDAAAGSAPIQPGAGAPTSPDLGQAPVAPSADVPALDTITENVQNFTDVPLESGSNPWRVASELLKQANPDYDTSTPEGKAGIQQVARMMCEKSNVSVPEWGLPDGIDQHKIPINHVLKVDTDVKSLLVTVAKGGK